MGPAEAAVQRQLDAYNDHDLERFIAEYTDDVRVFRPPAPEPVLSGKQAFADHYARNRFNVPELRGTGEPHGVWPHRVRPGAHHRFARR